MYSAYSVHVDVQCTVYCTVHYCTVHTVLYSVYTVYSIVQYCALYCVQYTVHCTVKVILDSDFQLKLDTYFLITRSFPVGLCVHGPGFQVFWVQVCDVFYVVKPAAGPDRFGPYRLGPDTRLLLRWKSPVSSVQCTVQEVREAILIY